MPNHAAIRIRSEPSLARSQVLNDIYAKDASWVLHTASELNRLLRDKSHARINIPSPLLASWRAQPLSIILARDWAIHLFIRPRKPPSIFYLLHIDDHSTRLWKSDSALSSRVLLTHSDRQQSHCPGPHCVRKSDFWSSRNLGPSETYKYGYRNIKDLQLEPKNFRWSDLPKTNVNAIPPSRSIRVVVGVLDHPSWLLVTTWPTVVKRATHWESPAPSLYMLHCNMKASNNELWLKRTYEPEADHRCQWCWRR